MAHTRKDTYAKPPERWDHLRPFNKRKVAKAERRAAKAIVEDVEPDETPKGLGLHNDPRKMNRLLKTKGESVIPSGIYCYDQKGCCPYFDSADNQPEQVNGYCWFLKKGDWDDGIGELWDQCKTCGVNDDWEEQE